jgi:hypothetical protein
MTNGTSAAAAGAIDRAALRRRLVDARAGIKRLIESVPGDAWSRPTANKAWNCGQLIVHVADSGGLMMLVERARRGKGLNIPMFLVNFVNVRRTRQNARKHTRESLIAGFDAETERLLALLDGTTDEQLAITVTIFGERTTVAALFERAPAHLAEHGPDIERAIVSA